MKSLQFTFIVFLLIYAPLVNIGIGPFGDSLALICLFLIAWFFLRGLNNKIIIFNEAKFLSAILILTMIYALFNSLFISSEPGSLQAALRPVRALITFLGIYAFLTLYVRYYSINFTNKLLEDIYLAIGLHATIMVLQFIWPEFRNFIYKYTFADQVIEFNKMFRMAGLTNGGGAILSVFQSFGTVIFPFLILTQESLYKRIITLLLFVLIFISTILSGRSGVIVSVLFTPIVFYLAYCSNKGLGITKKAKKAISVCLLLFIAAALIFYSVNYTKTFLGDNKTAYFTLAVKRGFQTFNNFISNDSIKDETISYLWDEHLFLPNSVTQFLLGDVSILELDRRGVDSDIGYVRFIFGYGVFGSLIQYLFYIIIFIYAINLHKINKDLSYLIILINFIILVFHWKEVFVFARIGFSITSLLTISAFYYKRIYKSEILKSQISEESL